MKKSQLNPWNWFKHEDAETNEGQRQGSGDSQQQGNHPMLRLQREFDRLLDDTFRDFNFPSLNHRWPKDGLFSITGFQAKLNVASDDHQYQISLEAPGLSQDDIHLEINKGALIISGEKKEENESKDKHYYRVERSFGSFRRVLTLPEDCDQDAITASMRNGLLDIVIPRKALPASQSKPIAINKLD